LKRVINCFKIISIYILCVSVWVSVCLFESNKCQNGWTHRIKNLCGISHDPREGLWIIKILKISPQQNSILIKFWKSTTFFYKIWKLLFCYYFTMYIHTDKMFTIEDSQVINKTYIIPGLLEVPVSSSCGTNLNQRAISFGWIYITFARINCLNFP